MKELSTEQKAKRYDEAVGKAKDMLSYKEVRREDMEYLFPELAESEDEKIRESLLEYLHTLPNHYSHSGVCAPEWIAWLEKQGNLMKALQISNAKIGELIEKNYYLKEQLEKQGEQKPVEPQQDMLSQEKYAKAVDECIYGEQKPTEEYNITGVGSKNAEGKLGEMIKNLKPTDKIESKFKAGDWIVDNNSGGVFQVTEIRDDEYCLWPLDAKEMGYLRIIDIDNDYHLWTINEAKPGDVLTYRDGQWCFIYKGTVTEDTFKYYALLSEKGITVNDSAFSLLTYCITPATKEQRDFLFQKMHEAGYEWDAEKKELKKIIDEKQIKKNLQDNSFRRMFEQKPVVEMKTPEESLDIDSDTYNKIVDECIYGEQKPTWSEEDEKMLGVAISDTFGNGHISVSDWLKSLKDRYTWKPSDEQMNALEHFVRSVGESGYASPYDNNTKLLYSLLSDLKKLREE